MPKPFLLFVLLILALSACSPQTAATPADPTALPKIGGTPSNQDPAPGATPMVETDEPPLTEMATATAALEMEEPMPASGAQTYEIVPQESTLTYEVDEVFINENNRLNTAVGVTGQVNGVITIDPANPASASMGEITADINQFKSDSNRRDQAVRTRFLRTDQFPMVTVKVTSIEGLPSSYTAGESLSFKITGDTTVRDVTRSVMFDVTAQLSNGSLTGEAVTTILMSDFGFGPISIAGILKTEDEVKLTLKFVARP
jgi:polyisoprenoid-binding protein YceI